jgi:hypothetical protein
MAYQKLQAERALKVIPDDNINIPNVAGPTVGGTTSQAAPAANQLVDNTKDFTAIQGLIGSIVYLTGGVATVTAVTNASTLTLSDAIANTGTTEAYTIYADDNNGCVLQTGLAGTIRVLTIGGDDVTFSVVAGAFVPVQVKRVLESGTMSPNDIIALW